MRSPLVFLSFYFFLVVVVVVVVVVTFSFICTWLCVWLGLVFFFKTRPLTRPSANLHFRFYCFFLGFNRFYWVLLGFTGFYWVLLGF